MVSIFSIFLIFLFFFSGYGYEVVLSGLLCVDEPVVDGGLGWFVIRLHVGGVGVFRNRGRGLEESECSLSGFASLYPRMRPILCRDRWGLLASGVI